MIKLLSYLSQRFPSSFSVGLLKATSVLAPRRRSCPSFVYSARLPKKCPFSSLQTELSFIFATVQTLRLRTTDLRVLEFAQTRQELLRLD